MSKALISIGKKDLEDIIKEDEKAELVCHFCNKKYQFTKEELENLLEELTLEQRQKLLTLPAELKHFT